MFVYELGVREENLVKRKKSDAFVEALRGGMDKGSIILQPPKRALFFI